MPLATPIQKLPMTAGSPPPPASMPEDSSVTDVLNEMESVVSMAKTYQDQPLPNAPNASGYAMPPMLPSPSIMPGSFGDYTAAPKPWFHLDTENGKRAAIAMLLALALFYPNGLFPALYHRIARLRFLESYDLFVRIFLLGVLFYVVMTYVPL